MTDFSFFSFGRYRLTQLLGRTSRYEVWRALDTEADHSIVFQVLSEHASAETKQRFCYEAAAVARLSHPHMVPIREVGEIDGRVYAAMQQIDDPSLEEVLNAGPLEPSRAVAIVEQVAAALHTLHEAGLVHGQIRASKILLGEEDFVHLIGCDFGLALIRDLDWGLGELQPPLGTLAPERLTSDQNATASADIYALACTLYHCLCGHLPFPGTTHEVVTGHLVLPPPKPSQSVFPVPRAMDEVIATGMAKSPAERYRTAPDLAVAARAALPIGRDGDTSLGHLQPIDSSVHARAAITRALFEEPHAVLLGRRSDTQFVETVFKGLRDEQPLWTCFGDSVAPPGPWGRPPGPYVTSDGPDSWKSPTHTFDYLHELVDPDYPLVGIFITRGVGAIDCTLLDKQLLANYAAAHDTANAASERRRSMMSRLCFSEPTAVIETGPVAAGVGVVIPQIADRPTIVYRLNPRSEPEDFRAERASIQFLKFVVPRQDAQAKLELARLGFARWIRR